MKKKHVKEILKNRKALALSLSALFLILTLTVSYAFFTGITNNDKRQEAKLNTGTMALTFRDGNNGVSAKLMLGESVTKKFIIENTGSLEASLSLDWDQLINTYMDGSLTYRLVRTENDVEVEEIIPKTNMPVSKEKLTQTLASELSVPSKKTYYYDLIITFNNLDVDQESDKEAVYNTHFNVDKPLQYRYYTLIVNPNGGTWKEFTTPQSYLLKNNESLKEVVNPTRVGYTFDGWELKGVSSEFKENKFTMGISDASLTAKWKPNKYNITIDPDGGEYPGDKKLNVDYGSTVTLEEPTKTGYTFSHWETTGGVLSDNTLTITEPRNVTVTAKWTPNKYSYIVRHNKQNINDDEYTTFETETIENVDYGTDVTPEFKTYDGFTQPTEKKIITIKEDLTQNIVEYNYDRIKYTLTVNPDGGNGGTSTQEVKYEGTVNLVAPNKYGCQFLNWTIESGTGTISDNTFKMGLGATTIKANWKDLIYSLTFNANGGTVNPESKKITYGETYGELPIPTRDDYVFLGWYTTNEKTGGTEITETTIVSVTSAQTIYARWGNNTILAVPNSSYAGEMWEHKENISKIIFENTMNAPTTYAYTYDISSVSDSSVMAYLSTDSEDSTKYVAHIQANGPIYANPDSSWLFVNFKGLKSIEGLEYLNTSKVLNMYGMFSNCTSLISLDISSFDTSNVTKMTSMFNWCTSLVNLDLNNLNMSKVLLIDYMFNNCISLTNVNLNNVNTNSITNMEYMFYKCENLKELDLSSFNTSKVTNMNCMFYWCSNLINLDISNFDTSNVTDMHSIFAVCNNLTDLDVSKFNTNKVIDMSGMFSNCKSLTFLDVNKFNTSNVTNMDGMFANCMSLTSLNVSSFDTSKVTNMSGMFQVCKILPSLDLSNFNTGKVTDMSQMFYGCRSLTSLNVSSFNTSNVTTMRLMFDGCSNLTSLNVNNFDTSNVKYMGGMFEDCSNLTSINVSNFKTSNVIDMDMMFRGCSGLTSLNVNSFDTSNVTSMGSMFENCTGLTSLNVNRFKTSKVTYMSYMFDGCTNLKSLNLQNWDVSAVTKRDGMFRYISSSIKITVSNTTMKSWIINISGLTTSNFIVS